MHLLKSKNEDVNTQWQSKSLQKNGQRKSASALDHHKMTPTLNFYANSLKQSFCPLFYTIASKQPLINHESDLALKCVRSVSKWIDSGGFRFMMKQWNSKGGKIKKQLTTVITISIQSYFPFHMGAAQICSAATLETLESGKRKSCSPLLSEVKSIWDFHGNTSKGKNSERSCYRNYGCCDVRNSCHFLN